MELKIYPEEKFERSPLRYIIFWIIAITIILLSFFTNNIYWGIVLVLLASVYIYFHIRQKPPITLTITPQGLKIWKQILWRINFEGYVIEIEKEEMQIKNIVFVFRNKHEIYTITDTLENIKKFSEALEQYIPRLGEYPQTGLEKFYRKIKL